MVFDNVDDILDIVELQEVIANIQDPAEEEFHSFIQKIKIFWKINRAEFIKKNDRIGLNPFCHDKASIMKRFKALKGF